MFFDFLSLLLGKIFFFTGAVQGKGSFPKPLSPEDEKSISPPRAREIKRPKIF